MNCIKQKKNLCLYVRTHWLSVYVESNVYSQTQNCSKKKFVLEFYFRVKHMNYKNKLWKIYMNYNTNILTSYFLHHTTITWFLMNFKQEFAQHTTHFSWERQWLQKNIMNLKIFRFQKKIVKKKKIDLLPL